MIAQHRRAVTVPVMLPPWFALVVLVLAIPLAVTAAVDAWNGSFLPNPVTWGLWTAAPLIAAAASAVEGAGMSALTTLSAGIGPAAILTAGLFGPHRSRRWRVGALDLVCGGLAVFALIGWMSTGSGMVAVALSVAADAFAGLPTMKKAWSYPSTESPWGYLAGALTGVAGLATLTVWSPANWLFPLYLVLWCGAITLLVVIPGNREKPALSSL